MAISRADRRRDRRDRVVAQFGPDNATAALDLLELVELAWHDCYGEITPSDDVIDDILLLAKGNLRDLIGVSRLAVTDWRDVRVAADHARKSAGK